MIEINKNISCEIIAKKVTKFTKIYHDKQEWNIHTGKWKRLQVAYSFNNSTHIHIRRLELYSNKQPQIIKQLISPLLYSLTHLNLKNNKIVSLQAIFQLKAPKLKELLLSDNQITNLKSIAKLNCPELETLNANRIVEITAITDTNFPKLKHLIIGLNSLSNFQPLNKCKWPSIEKISIQNNRKCCVDFASRSQWSHKQTIIFG